MFTRYIAAAAAALALVGCTDTTEPGAGLRYFPLEVGNRWTYAPEDPAFGDPFEWVVTERHGDTVALARPAGPSHPGPVTLLDREDGIDLLVAGESFAPFYRFDAGAAWTHRDPWECDDAAVFTAVEETEPIVTPAGTFEHTLRIERRTTAICDDAGTVMEWWAPNVGLVRWDELNFWAGGPLSYYLTSYAQPF